MLRITSRALQMRIAAQIDALVRGAEAGQTKEK